MKKTFATFLLFAGLVTIAHGADVPLLSGLKIKIVIPENPIHRVYYHGQEATISENSDDNNVLRNYIQIVRLISSKR
ncbi:hypothetical protein C1645_838158 [Glomus cerebriforme]|uniref:Uncharacterized protein n=1 Tax=Glomus cerebriforme TaxID=658196 RepID=A0A397S2V0_9GLOM|nr:hypothetical protein C1645_838158 [Glomus cerebriforme]